VNWQAVEEFLKPNWKKIILTFSIVLFWQLITWLSIPREYVALSWEVSVEGLIWNVLKLLYYYPFACLLVYLHTMMRERRLMKFLHTGKSMLLVFGMILLINPFSWWIIFSGFYEILGKLESLSFCGVLIEVIPESPAEYVGMMSGQVIVKVDGNPISNVAQLRETLSRKKTGDFIEIRTLDGQSFNFTLESNIYPNQPSMGIANLTNFRCFKSYRE